MTDPIVVVGGSLAGMAAAARLAKARHRVLLLEETGRLGGRWADTEADVLPPVLTFPAPWRDLFKKSGRAFDAELGRHDVGLIAAPPAVHHFADGATLTLPSDRGQQWTTLSQAYGESTAKSWQALLDDLDDTWQRLRPLGLEGEFTDDALTWRRRAGLHPRVSVEDVARRLNHPHLGEIVRSVAWRLGSQPRLTPGWCAVRLSVERTFGRWRLVEQEQPAPTVRLLDLLTERLATRGVEVHLESPVTAIEPYRVRTRRGWVASSATVCTVNPWSYATLADRSDREMARRIRWSKPAMAPSISARLLPDSSEVSEAITHTPGGPIVEYHRPTSSGTLVTTHDHRQGRPDPSFGTQWHGWRTWLRMPPLRSGIPMTFLASASSRGGNDPWAQLLSGALATYLAHEHLAGADIRPTNKAYRG
ncbi:MAG: FAD-dependent oxidoreductase [Micropruina sp.]|nr:NAD(P)-binding protein [Micropruina sp.]